MEGLYALKDESTALDRRFANWQDSRVTEFKPTSIGKVLPRQPEFENSVGCWPGKVDTYVDLYLAGVWNIFRAARIMLIALIVKLSADLGESDSCDDCIHTANRLVEDMAASIPYHLAENLQEFFSELETGTGVTQPGRSLGGLLLIHPLYVISNMSFVPESMRVYVKRCLEWIGNNMGLGQAILLAKVRKLEYWLVG